MQRKEKEVEYKIMLIILIIWRMVKPELFKERKL